MPTLFQRSSLTFGEAKTEVARKHSKQANTDMLDRAGSAIQRAFQDWNKTNWEWLITAAPSISVSAGVDNTLYPVPYNYKDMYNIVLEQGGTKRALVSDTKRHYDRVVPMPLTSITTGYNLHRLGDLGKFQIQDPSNSDGTITLLYYRRMVVPCSISCSGFASTGVAPTLAGGSSAGWTIGNAVSVATTGKIAPGTVVTTVNPNTVELSTTLLAGINSGDVLTVGGDDQHLDVHTDFTWALLARACEHFLADVGTTDTKMQYWMAQAAKGIEDAKGAQAQKDDRELAFEPLPWFGGYNPNRIIE